MFDRFGNKIGHLRSLSSTDDFKAIFIHRSYSSLTLYYKELMKSDIEFNEVCATHCTGILIIFWLTTVTSRQI